MATESEAPIAPVHLMCEMKSAGCLAGRSEKTLPLEVIGVLAGVATAVGDGLGLRDAADVLGAGLPDAEREAVGDGEALVQALAITITAIATITLSRWVVPPRPTTRAAYSVAGALATRMLPR